MSRVLSWMVGVGVGGTLAAVLIALLVPVSGRTMRERIRGSYLQVMAEAHQASELRRAELAAQLSDLRKDSESKPLANR